MGLRTTRYNFLVIFLICLCFFAPVVIAADVSRNFVDVPSWIIQGSDVKPGAERGYQVDDPLSYSLGGFSSFGGADSPREEVDVPPWILAAAGVSGVIALGLTIFQFLPVLLGRNEGTTPNPVRSGILEVVLSNPGCSVPFLRQKTGINRSTLRYHLVVLEKEQKILSRKLGRSYHYFPNGSTLSYADTIRITLCQNSTTGKILDIIEAEPGISGTILAARAGISAGTLTWHLGRLEENNLITISRNGRGMQIYPAG